MACDDFCAAVKCSVNLSTAGPNNPLGGDRGVEEGNLVSILGGQRFTDTTSSRGGSLPYPFPSVPPTEVRAAEVVEWMCVSRGHAMPW